MPSQVWLSKICAKGNNKERKKEEKQIQTDKRYTNKTDTFLKFRSETPEICLCE